MQKLRALQIRASNEDFPFVLVIPLCEEDTWFDEYERLINLLEYVKQEEKADKYLLSGVSMGAYTGWQVLASKPDLFDKAILLCGGGMYWNAGRIKTPVWAFHGKEDMLAVVGRMKNGVIFSLDPSWSRAENKLKVPGPGWEVFPKRMEVNLVIHGDEGSVYTDCFGPNTYHNGEPDNKYTVQYTYFDEWVGLIDEFVENIETKRLPKINLGWHKNTIKAMNAVYESISTGKAVRL